MGSKPRIVFAAPSPQCSLRCLLLAYHSPVLPTAAALQLVTTPLSLPPPAPRDPPRVYRRASQKAIEDINEHANKRGVRAAHRAALLAQLSFTVEGYEMCGITITPEMAVQFLWAQMLVLWGSFSSAFVRV